MAVPPAVVTLIRPVLAPVGTLVVILEPESTEEEAGLPPNVTRVAPERCAPEMVTVAPTLPE